MPDGTPIQLYDEAWKTPEALFNPGAVGLEGGGVAGLVHECVQSTEVDLRKTLLNNIVLSGGTTMFPNFDKRLSQELMMLSTSQSPTRVLIT